MEFGDFAYQEQEKRWEKPSHLIVEVHNPPTALGFDTSQNLFS
jgi:hypothetical protein